MKPIPPYVRLLTVGIWTLLKPLFMGFVRDVMVCAGYLGSGPAAGRFFLVAFFPSPTCSAPLLREGCASHGLVPMFSKKGSESG